MFLKKTNKETSKYKNVAAFKTRGQQTTAVKTAEGANGLEPGLIECLYCIKGHRAGNSVQRDAEYFYLVLSIFHSHLTLLEETQGAPYLRR